MAWKMSDGSLRRRKKLNRMSWIRSIGTYSLGFAGFLSACRFLEFGGEGPTTEQLFGNAATASLRFVSEKENENAHARKQQHWIVLNKTVPEHHEGEEHIVQATHESFEAKNCCYSYLQGRCAAVACPGSDKAFELLHLRGNVREIASNMSQTLRGTCKVCNLYVRQCAVSRSEKFIFIHVMKSGGSSFHRFLKSALCAEVYKGTKRKFNCSEDHLAMMPCAKAIRLYPALFKWTFVRHPFSRAVSGWAMASSKAIGNRVPFNEWALNTSSMQTKVYSMHWWPQTSFLLDDTQCPIYDYAGSLGKDFASDFKYVLKRINSDALLLYYEKHGFPHENRAAQSVSTDAIRRNMSESARKCLRQRYDDDFRLFGFSEDEWDA